MTVSYRTPPHIYESLHKKASTPALDMFMSNIKVAFYSSRLLVAYTVLFWLIKTFQKAIIDQRKHFWKHSFFKTN